MKLTQERQKILDRLKREFTPGTTFNCVHDTGVKTIGRVDGITVDSSDGNFLVRANGGSAYIYDSYKETPEAKILSRDNAKFKEIMTRALDKKYPPGTVFVPAHLTAKNAACTVGPNERYIFDARSAGLSSGNNKKNGHGYSEHLYYEGKFAKVITEAEVKPSKSETNLQKAKRLYPEGTKHYGYNTGKASKGTPPYTVKGELYEAPGDSIYSSSTGCIYSSESDTWAVREEDITKPKKYVEPKIGDYIVVEEGSNYWCLAKITRNSTRKLTFKYGDFIAYYNKEKTNQVFKKDHEFAVIAGNRTFRKATENEIMWLDHAIRKNKYISYDDFVATRDLHVRCTTQAEWDRVSKAIGRHSSIDFKKVGDSINLAFPSSSSFDAINTISYAEWEKTLDVQDVIDRAMRNLKKLGFDKKGMIYLPVGRFDERVSTGRLRVMDKTSEGFAIDCGPEYCFKWSRKRGERVSVVVRQPPENSTSSFDTTPVKPTFAVGDIIRGTSNTRYGITTADWVGVVTEILFDGNLKVETLSHPRKDSGSIFTVDPAFFEHEVTLITNVSQSAGDVVTKASIDAEHKIEHKTEHKTRARRPALKMELIPVKRRKIIK